MNPARSSTATGVEDSGWYRDRIGNVDIAFVHGTMTEASFEHFLAEACRSIDECADDARVAMFLEVREPALMDGRWRKRMAKELKLRADKLARTRPAYAMVTSSIVVRSALKVMHWAAPPPYPHTVVGSIQEAFEFIARHVPGLDAREIRLDYERRRASVLALPARG
jgi:hypothetical protein